ncbi:MAG: hypothetical protein RJA61_630 [Candidatus Parcubacteria bacterium]|jgi:prepilin-type N-terminal cleavage/methylation domain-containing protein
MNKKAFTLIELLLVIAIIGILSSITLAALNATRDKSKDAKIKAELAQLNASAELYFDSNGHYGTETNSCLGVGSFFVSTSPANLISAAEFTSGTSATCVSDNDSGSVGNATSWAVSVPLKTDPLTSWCANSIGVSQIGTAQISGNQAVCI